MCGARGAAPGPPCRDRDPLPPRVIVFKAGWVQTNVFVSPRMVLHFLQKTTRGRSGASRLVPASGSPLTSASDAIPEARGRTPPPSPSSPASRTRFNPPRCARVMARKSDARLASTAAADRCFTIMLQQCDPSNYAVSIVLQNFIAYSRSTVTDTHEIAVYYLGIAVAGSGAI